jgi:asparagine synthase (glutamine-hydrolysing)
LIAGVVASCDQKAARIIDCLVRVAPAGISSHTVRGGVGIACWTGPRFVSDPRLEGDVALVGTLRSTAPTAGSELKGDFALVGRRSGRLVLARGRFCGRSVYFCRVGDATVACTRLLPLAALLRGNLRLNIDHLCAPLDGRSWAWLNPLPFEGMRSVPLNSRVEIDARGTEEISRPTLALGPALRCSEAELASRLREELCAAVARQSGSARKVGVMTGGGLDSSGVVACAVLNQRRGVAGPVVASALDHGGYGDDRPHLRALCAHLDIEPIRVKPAEAVSRADHARIVDGSIQAYLPGSGTLALVHRAREAGAEVVMTGEGSELALDTISDVFADFLRTAPGSALTCLARFRGVDETWRQSVRRLAVGPLARAIVPTRVREALRRSVPRPAPEWVAPRLEALLRRPLREPGAPVACSQRDRVARLASSPLLTATIDHLLRWEIATGVRFSFPYLDDDFLQFVGRVPSSAVFAGARDRGLLRESLAGIVPDSLRYRTDKARPYQAVVEQYEAMGGFAAVGDLVTMRELGRLGLVHPEKFRRNFEAWASDPAPASGECELLWGAIAGEAYVRQIEALNAPLALDAPPIRLDVVTP